MITWESLAERLGNDGEFLFAARLWDARLRLDLGGDSRRITIAQGRVSGVEPCEPGSDCDVFISAPAEIWERMLEPQPAPFFHDLIAAQMHHGLAMNPDFLDYAAYYPAMRRLLEVMRELRRQG